MSRVPWMHPPGRRVRARPVTHRLAPHLSEGMRLRALDAQFDFKCHVPGSHSPVSRSLADPMVAEADMCTPARPGPDTYSAARSFDCFPCGSRGWGSARRGFIWAALVDDPGLLMGRSLFQPRTQCDEPDWFMGPSFQRPVEDDRELVLHVDLCLPGLEVCSSGLPSPWPRADVEHDAEQLIEHSHLGTVKDDAEGYDVVERSPCTEPEAANLFINSLKKGLDQPLLSTPILRVTRRARVHDDGDFVPKRSA